MVDSRTLQILEVVLFFANKVFAATSKVPLKPFYRDIFILNEALVIWNNFEIFRDEVSHIYKNFKTIKNDMYFQTNASCSIPCQLHLERTCVEMPWFYWIFLTVF